MLELEERSNHKHSSTTQDSALIATIKANSDHFAFCGTPHDRGGHHQPRRGGRNSRSSHHGITSGFGQSLQRQRPNSSFVHRPNSSFGHRPSSFAPPSGPSSFNPWHSPSWPYWATQTWAEPPTPFLLLHELFILHKAMPPPLLLDFLAHCRFKVTTPGLVLLWVMFLRILIKP